MEQTFQFKTHQKIYLGVKRCLDFIIALLLILILLLPMGIIAIITKATTRGSIIFTQKRMGKDKVFFNMHKFRSMHKGAPQIGQDGITEEIKAKYISKWGKFMRATSIDELPQLFSVLTGKMSFLGPRPNLEEQYDVSLVKARDSFDPSPYLVKPGLSGLAQVKLHRDFNPMHKAELDSQYIRNLSFKEDFLVFFASFGVIFNRENRKTRKLEDVKKD